MSSGRSALYAECIAQYVASGGLDPNSTSHTAEVIRQSASRTSQLGLRVAQTVFSSSLNADEHGAASSINAHLQMLADDFLQSCSKYGVLSIPPIYVGWSPDTSAEGRVRQVDEGYLITINAGLTLLHSYVGRLLMMRGSTTVEVGGRVYSNLVSRDREDWQIGRDIGDALLGFVVGDLSRINPISSTLDVRGISSVLLPSAANTFVIGHEVCHILQGHVGATDYDKLRRFKRFAFSPPIPREWESEVLSDVFALQILLSDTTRKSWLDVAGALLAVSIDHALWGMTSFQSFRDFIEWDSGIKLPDLTSVSADSRTLYPPPPPRTALLMAEINRNGNEKLLEVAKRYRQSFEEGVNWAVGYVGHLTENIMERIAATGAPGFHERGDV